MALLLDGRTGEIINASKSDITGVMSSVDANIIDVNDAVGDAPVYNAQGIMVAKSASDTSHLPKGIYISAGRKIVVK